MPKASRACRRDSRSPSSSSRIGSTSRVRERLCAVRPRSKRPARSRGSTTASKCRSRAIASLPRPGCHMPRRHQTDQTSGLSRKRIDQPLIRHVAVEHQDGRIVEPDQLVDLLAQALVPALDVAAEQAVKGQILDQEALLAHDPDRLREGEEHRLERLRAAPRDREHPGQMADADAVRGHEQDPPLAARRRRPPGRFGAAGRSDPAGAPRAPRGRSAAHQRRAASALAQNARRSAWSRRTSSRTSSGSA